jgi:hypothetical protein
MSDTIPFVLWSVGAKDGSPSGRFRLSRRGDKTLEEVLWETIGEEGWGERLPRLFPITNSLWHTFWMDSPLSSEQIGFLHDLFAALGKRPDCSESYLSEFLGGLDEASKCHLPVYVTLTPPGHCDMGWVTIFPHCPRCKAEAPPPRWQESYFLESMDCPVCGTSYRPAETYSSERYYYTETVVCSSCQQKYPIRIFSEEERELLEHHHYYETFVAELTMLRRIEAFYGRHPDMKDRIRPHFISVIESDNDTVREQPATGRPFDHIALPADASFALPDGRQWSQGDEEVVEYLKHNSMSLYPRMKFVSESIERLRPVVEQQHVRCPQCGGKVG